MKEWKRAWTTGFHRGYRRNPFLFSFPRTSKQLPHENLAKPLNPKPFRDGPACYNYSRPWQGCSSNMSFYLASVLRDSSLWENDVASRQCPLAFCYFDYRRHSCFVICLARSQQDSQTFLPARIRTYQDFTRE